MKKITSILILLLLTFDTAGFYLIFILRQMEAKEEAIRKIASDLPDEFLEKFTFDKKNFTNSNSGIVWEEEEKEFWFGDKLYDVVKIEYSEDTVKISCLNDDNEESIIKNFNGYFHKNSEHENKLLALFVKFPGYFFEEIRNELPDLTEHSFFVQDKSHFENFITDTETPPPRLTT